MIALTQYRTQTFVQLSSASSKVLCTKTVHKKCSAIYGSLDKTTMSLIAPVCIPLPKKRVLINTLLTVAST